MQYIYIYIKREFICKGLVRIILWYDAETWALNTQRDNKLPATETDFLEKTLKEIKQMKVWKWHTAE